MEKSPEGDFGVLGGLERNQARQRMIYPAGTGSEPDGFLYRL